MDTIERPELAAIIKPTRDALKASASLGPRQVRNLVDSFYQIQELRKGVNNQRGAIIRDGERGLAQEPHETLDWLSAQAATIEGQLQRAFQYYAEGNAPGRWLLSVVGIGPVLAANFLARLSVHPWRCRNPQLTVKRAEDEDKVFPCADAAPCTAQCAYETVETAGGFWRFAGLDPTVKWEKGELRPWNAALKVACWKASDSWVKLKNNPQSFYSRVYVERKAREIEQNESGGFKEQAAARVSSVGMNTIAGKAYRAGKLPPAHIEARAKRFAVRLFLSHLHQVMYEEEFGRPPPKPFAIGQQGHAHYIPPPGWP